MRLAKCRNERGAITVWLVAALLAFLLIVGLGVDLVGHARAEQLARNVAAEAARAGAQHVGFSDGGAIKLEMTTAKAAATTYLESSPYQGKVQVSDTTVTVEARGHYDCLFLELIGIQTLPVTALGTADAVAGST